MKDSYLERLFHEPTFFVHELWKDIGLDKKDAPFTFLEDDLVDFMFTPGKKRIVLGPRGIGKTTIAQAYVCWRFIRDPNSVVKLMSKRQNHAVNSVRAIRTWLTRSEILKHLEPSPVRDFTDKRRDSAIEFDIFGREVEKDPSLAAQGMESAITGGRASDLIGDDVENEHNTKTEESRQRLFDRVLEFTNICSFGERQLILLGTRWNDDCVYDKLADAGWDLRAYPVSYPKRRDRIRGLAPVIQERLDTGKARYTDDNELYCDNRTMPQRYDRDHILEHEAHPRNFKMQFQLQEDDRGLEFPLKLGDLMVPEWNLDPKQGPSLIFWGRTDTAKGRTTACKDEVGFMGKHNDTIRRPAQVGTDTVPYDRTVMYVDPSGQGTDETAWAVVSNIGSMLYVKDVNGSGSSGKHSGFSPEVLDGILACAKRWGVHTIYAEPNYGGGQFAALLKSHTRHHFDKGWSCGIEDAKWSKGRKEERILDTLEPVFSHHRIVINEACLRPLPDLNQQYELQHQIANITREKGSLRHDDRLEAMAGAVAMFTRDLGLDPHFVDEQRQARLLEEAWEAEFGKYGVEPTDPLDMNGKQRSKLAEAQ